MKQSKLDSKLTMAGSQKKKRKKKGRPLKVTGNKPTIDCAAAEKHRVD